MDSRGRHVPAEGWWGCEERLNDWWTRECTPIVFETQLVDPLDDLKKLQNKARTVSDGVICAGCQTHLIIALEKYREAIWSDLRKDFLLVSFVHPLSLISMLTTDCSNSVMSVSGKTHLARVRYNVHRRPHRETTTNRSYICFKMT